MTGCMHHLIRYLHSTPDGYRYYCQKCNQKFKIHTGIYVGYEELRTDGGLRIVYIKPTVIARADPKLSH